MPTMTKQCNGAPKSTVRSCFIEPATTFWSSLPSRAKPTQIVFSPYTVILKTGMQNETFSHYKCQTTFFITINATKPGLKQNQMSIIRKKYVMIVNKA